jgi:hypothetical protein
VHVGAVFAQEDAQPHDAVGRRVLLAIEAVFVVGDREFIFEELFELCWLWSSASLEELGLLLLLDRLGLSLL